ncbi:MAG: hypothetical protein AB7S38_11185 [Vulcanimicrobiota bacterium]
MNRSRAARQAAIDFYRPLNQPTPTPPTKPKPVPSGQKGNSMSESYPAKVPLCGLWARESKNGTRYYVGRLGGARVLVFANQQKNDDRDPDLQVYLQAAPPQQAPPAQEPRRQPQPPRQSDGLGIDDIPF